MPLGLSPSSAYQMSLGDSSYPAHPHQEMSSRDRDKGAGSQQGLLLVSLQRKEHMDRAPVVSTAQKMHTEPPSVGVGPKEAAQDSQLHGLLTGKLASLDR